MSFLYLWILFYLYEKIWSTRNTLLYPHQIVLFKAEGVALNSSPVFFRRLFVNKIYKSQIFNLNFKSGYASIFSFEGILVGSGRRYSQFF